MRRSGIGARAEVHKFESSFIWSLMTPATVESLHVNLQPSHGGESVAHGFPHRGMRVNHVHHVVDRALELQNRRGFPKNFRGQRADDVDAEHFPVLFVGNHLDEAAVIAKDGGFAVADEREFSRLHTIASFFGLFFGESDRANLGLAICSVRNARSYNGLRGQALDMRYSDDAFHHRGVSKLWHSGDNIADGVQTGLIGLHELVHVYEAVLDPGLGFFDAAVFRHSLAPDREEQLLRLQGLGLAVFVLEGNRDALGVFLYAVYHAAGLNVDSLFAECLIQLGGDFFVLDRNDAGQCLQDSDLRAKGIEDGSKFHADGARADDDQRFRNFRKLEDGTIRQDRLMIGLDAGK